MQIERFLSQDDASTLSRLAEHLLRVGDEKFNFAERLIDLIGTSILVPENAQRPDCVALYSNVIYREVGSKENRSIVIVCPNDANNTLARVSILAPLALALIGHPKHSIVEVNLPFDQVQMIEILDVQDTSCGLDEPIDSRKSHAGADVARP